MSILHINNRWSRGLLNGVIAVGLFSFISGITQQSLAQSTQPTVEQRQAMTERHKKMADMHSEMASCLASDLTMQQCRQQFRDTFNSSIGSNWQSMGQGPKASMHMRGNRMMSSSQCMDWMNDTELENAPENPRSAPKK